jgi:hypothetical protein
VILYRNGKGFDKNCENKICSQMYEVFDLNEAYVVWKMTIELNQSHEVEGNKSKPEEQKVPSKSRYLFGSIFWKYYFFLMLKK